MMMMASSLSHSSSSSSWQFSFIKLISLLILLPFIITYLHLTYYAYRRNEFCFVGRGAAVHTTTTSESDVAVDNRLRGDGSTMMISENDDYSSVINSDIPLPWGIYAPTELSWQKQKKKRKQVFHQRQFRQMEIKSTTSTITTPIQLWLLRNNIMWGNWPSVTQLSYVISYSPPSSTSTQSDESSSNHHVISIFDENDGSKRWCLHPASTTASSTSAYCSDALTRPTNDDGSSTTIYVFPPSGIWKKAMGNSSNTQKTSSSTSSTASSSHVVVYCPSSSPPTIISVSNAAAAQTNKNPWQQQQERRNQNVQFLLNQPATSLLLLLNIGLAFHYWNQRVSPASVCKRYTNIAEDHEWWRGLTGATAHFEPLHIGFNAMSLHSLGRELEGGPEEGGGGRGLFGSIPFLVYNIALVVCTTVVMMGIVCARVWYIQTKLKGINTNNDDNTASTLLRTHYTELHDRLRETSTVGYSAVLFAWMVVSTMERTQPTCPIPFFSDVCFETHSVPGIPSLKFNIAPIASLFVAQFIMPRASFTGHLAGIVCGYCLHWGWFMPPLEVCSPNVLIGGVFLIGLVWRRRVIPVKPLLLAAISDEEGCAEHEDYLRSLLLADDKEEDDDGMGGVEGEEDDAHLSYPQNGSGLILDHVAIGRKKKRERELNEARQKQKTILFVRNLIGVVTFASLLFFEWTSSLILAQFIVLAYFVLGTQSSMLVWAYTRSKVETDILVPEKKRSGMIWRGMLMSATLTTVVDSMTCASWYALPVSAAWQHSSLGAVLGLIPISLVLAIRTTANLCALVISSKILHDMSEVGDGIFHRVFSCVIQWSKCIGDHVILVSHKRQLWTAFEGRGIALGRRNPT